MKRPEAIQLAKIGLAKSPATQVILRRGSEYKVQSISHETPRGWKVAEMLSLGNVQNF